jgi:DHA2 family multidrug resistance protein
LINAPVGLLALAGCYFLLREPDYLVAQRAELRKQPFRLDSIGLSLLAIVIVCREVMLSKGQEWDWLGDPFWRIQTLAICFIAGLAGLVFWEMRHRNPVVNFRPLGERNFAACSITRASVRIGKASLSLGSPLAEVTKRPVRSPLGPQRH